MSIFRQIVRFVVQSINIVACGEIFPQLLYPTNKRSTRKKQQKTYHQATFTILPTKRNKITKKISVTFVLFYDIITKQHYRDMVAPFVILRLTKTWKSSLGKSHYGTSPESRSDIQLYLELWQLSHDVWSPGTRPSYIFTWNTPDYSFYRLYKAVVIVTTPLSRSVLLDMFSGERTGRI